MQLTPGTTGKNKISFAYSGMVLKMPRKKNDQIQDQEIPDIPDNISQEPEIPEIPGNTGNSDPVQEIIAELQAQGISTPEQLRQFLSNVSALSLQVQELQQRLQEMQQKQQETQNLKTELEDLKTLTAKGKEIQELKKVFSSSSPLESALAWKVIMGNNTEIDQLRQEIQSLKQQLVESQYSRRIAELESMIQAYAQQPRPNPIQEIKEIITTYKTLQSELSSLGIGKESGKESLLSSALDKIGAKLADMAEKYGLIDMLTGQAPAQGTGSPPPPPSGNPGPAPPAGPTTYTQAEFNQASREWISRIRGKLLPGQIVTDDQGFIAGRDPTHIRRYLTSHPQQIQPYYEGDYYVVPNIYARDFIAFCTMPAQGKGGVNAPRPGF
jgi:hypothetical protein